MSAENINEILELVARINRIFNVASDAAKGSNEQTDNQTVDLRQPFSNDTQNDAN